MANEYPTFLDLAKKTGSDPIVGLVEANLGVYPELQVLPARTIAGTTFKTLLRTSYPTAVFRNPNEGAETRKGAYENKLAQCHFIDLPLEVDEAIVTADDGNIEDIMTMESSGAMKGIMRTVSTQYWYGTTADAKGFPGAVSVVNSDLTVNAEGTTSSTGSSCWLVVPGAQNCQFVFGGGNVMQMPAWTKQRITRDSKQLTAWITNISGWVGAQWFNTHSLGRIYNLTEDSGHGLTDALVADLIAKFPDDLDLSGAHLFVTRRSARQLQKSRSATTAADNGVARTASGVELIAPWPTSSNGIPIHITSAISNTESIISP